MSKEEWKQVASRSAREIVRRGDDARDDGWTVGKTVQRGDVFWLYMSRVPLPSWEIGDLDMYSPEHRCEIGRRLHEARRLIAAGKIETALEEIDAIAEKLRSDHAY